MNATDVLLLRAVEALRTHGLADREYVVIVSGATTEWVTNGLHPEKALVSALRSALDDTHLDTAAARRLRAAVQAYEQGASS